MLNAGTCVTVSERIIQNFSPGLNSIAIEQEHYGFSDNSHQDPNVINLPEGEHVVVLFINGKLFRTLTERCERTPA